MYTIEKIEQFKLMTNELKGYTPEPLAEELISRFADYWRTRFIGFSNKIESIPESVQELIRYRYDSQACCCMGAQEWPWCPCEVGIKLETYRFDVATYILTHGQEIESLEEAIEIWHKANNRGNGNDG